MSEVYPISCISCRRKKIKCNKHKPCDQCKKRHIVCQFPSTFRNIEIKESPNQDLLSEKDEKFYDQEDLFMIINKLKSEKDDALNKYYQTSEFNKKLTRELEQMKIQSNYFASKSESNPNEPEPFPISGETTEFGKKYYGPQSSSFMIETLKSHEGSKDTSNYPRKHLDEDEYSKVQQSFIKKPLPKLKHGIPASENMNIINKLVEKFFQNYLSNYYKTFISKINLKAFLSEYENLDNNLWENDDDLLLLIMILNFAVVRCTPAELSEIFGVPIEQTASLSHALINNNLMHKFEKLRHNLMNESILTIQSYILCTEFYFIQQRYEECWHMMFHTCSIAYSIGLHVTGKLQLNKLNEIDLNIGSDSTLDTNEYDEMEDINKLKVWFSLRILSDKICSVLGRPNPISFQINSIILKYNQNYSNINLFQNTTSILLKIGLSECLRLSNMMLIENFMIDFTMSDLLNLNSKFEKEIYLIDLYLNEFENGNSTLAYTSEADAAANSRLRRNSKNNSHESELASGYGIGDDHDSANELSYDELNFLPIKIEQIDLLNDLIVFYINRAKLFEPFIIKFNKVENDAILVLDNLSNLILNFLKLITRLFQIFENKLSKKKIHELKIGKHFRINFPFLNAFIYQGIVIIFTLLNYKSKDFVSLKYNEKFDNIRFLKQLKLLLINLLEVDQSFDERIWSVNITFLVNKDIDIINHIERQISQETLIDEELATFNNALLNEQSFHTPTETQPATQSNIGLISNSPMGAASQQNQFLGFNLSDPFWITNPDNLPYYLGSPNDDQRNNAYAMHETHHDINTARMGESNVNQFNEMEIGPRANLRGIPQQTHVNRDMRLNSSYNQPMVKQELSQEDKSNERAEEKNKKMRLDDFLPYSSK